MVLGRPHQCDPSTTSQTSGFSLRFSNVIVGHPQLSVTKPVTEHWVLWYYTIHIVYNGRKGENRVFGLMLSHLTPPFQCHN